MYIGLLKKDDCLSLADLDDPITSWQRSLFAAKLENNVICINCIESEQTEACQKGLTHGVAK